jgi:hypothetical protein
MAELPQLVGGRAQVAGVPNVALPEVRFGQRDVSSAYRAQAEYQGTMAQVINRMTQAVFGAAEDMSVRAGLQFSAENPLTQEQLEAMSKGDMSQVQLGSPLNVFNAAVRKARAIELSGHAEIEARQQIEDLIQKAELGEIDTDSLYGQITAITNGYGESLAKVDPDSAFKFRATVSAIGGRAIEKVAEMDAIKRRNVNMVKVDQLMNMTIKEIERAATTKMPIDPNTGQEMSVDSYINALKENFVTNANALVGGAAASQMYNQLNASVDRAKVSAISQYLNTNPAFSNSANGIERLLRGDAGSASNAFQSLPANLQDQVIAEYRDLKAQRRADMEFGIAQSGKARDAELRGLIFQFYDPTTPPEIREQIGRTIASDNSISTSQIQTFLNPSRPAGDPVTYSKLEYGVKTGVYSSIDQVESDAIEAGMNGKQVADLIQAFTAGPVQTAPERAAFSSLRQWAGVPDVVSSFTSDAERQRYTKLQEGNRILNELVTEYRTKNPMAVVPYDELSKQAIELYEATTGSAAAEQQVIGAMQQILENAAKKAEREGDAKKAADIRSVQVSPTMSPADLRERRWIDAATQQALEAQLNGLRNR